MARPAQPGREGWSPAGEWEGSLGESWGEEEGNVGWRDGGGLSSGHGLVLTNCQFQRGCN